MNALAVQERHNWICDQLAEGHTGHALQLAVMKRFQLNRDQAAAVITQARAAIRETFELDRADLAVQLLAMHHEVFVAAMAARQYSAAVGALSSIGRLTGVEAPRA